MIVFLYHKDETIFKYLKGAMATISGANLTNALAVVSIVDKREYLYSKCRR